MALLYLGTAGLISYNVCFREKKQILIRESCVKSNWTELAFWKVPPSCLEAVLYFYWEKSYFGCKQWLPFLDKQQLVRENFFRKKAKNTIKPSILCHYTTNLGEKRKSTYLWSLNRSIKFKMHIFTLSDKDGIFFSLKFISSIVRENHGLSRKFRSKVFQYSCQVWLWISFIIKVWILHILT